MHHANLPIEMWYHLFGEIFTTVTLLDSLTVIEINKNVCHSTNIFGEIDTILPVISLFSLRSNNSMTRTSQ